MGQLFGIHPLTVEDIVTGADREKCELYDSYTFIVSRALINSVRGRYDMRTCAHGLGRAGRG